MRKTVQLLGTVDMPVVEEIVVKQSPAHELGVLEAEGEKHRHVERGLGHGNTVVIASAGTMLLERFELFEKSGVKNRCRKLLI